jgi:hypothetical protein
MSTMFDSNNTLRNHVDFNIGYENETLLYFTKEPKMSILNCSPIIEQINISITVARSTNQVLSARILADPQPVLAAWGYLWDIIYESPYSNQSVANARYVDTPPVTSIHADHPFSATAPS